MSKMVLKLLYYCIIGMLLTATPLMADDNTDNTELSWESLTATQQKILKPVADKWPELSLKRKQRLLNGAARWQKMDPTERKRAKERLKRWKNMAPELRQRIKSILNPCQWKNSRLSVKKCNGFNVYLKKNVALYGNVGNA